MAAELIINIRVWTCEGTNEWKLVIEFASGQLLSHFVILEPSQIPAAQHAAYLAGVRAEAHIVGGDLLLTLSDTTLTVKIPWDKMVPELASIISMTEI